MTRVSNAVPAYEYKQTNASNGKTDEFNLFFPAISKQMPRSIGKLPNIDLNQTDFLYDEKDKSYLC